MTQSPSPPPIQAVAAGQVPSAVRFAQLGFASRAMSYPLTRMFGMLVGEQNCGKTYVMQSCEDAFIINCDLSGSPNPNAVSMSWPGIDPEGNCLDVGNRPFVLTWDDVERKVDQLVQLAKTNQPRPAMIVFDTIAGMIRLLQPWVANSLNRSSFSDCDGRQAWDRLYAHIVDRVAMRLRAAGYGVWFIAHLGRSWVQIDDQRSTEAIDFTMGTGLRHRLSAIVEVIVPVVSNKTVVPRTSNQIIPLPGGKSTTRPVHTSETVTTRKFAFGDPRYSSIARARVPNPLSDIDFTDSPNPWQRLVQEYDLARGTASPNPC